MTNKEYEQTLRDSVKFWEESYIYYKKELEGIFKDKKSFPADDQLVIWYKDFLRVEKNEAEKMMKESKEELVFFRNGLNPPYIYTVLKK